ncbi:uncharacterized protein B0P05DRAFT_572952 [Gilbertella persicaria]|uniref:Coiled-coil domain-containing protein 174 n=1 Tax=Rhizopus stolonifer TaxID=4846 RepID=A0A367JI75_RHIST|nr:uncharacterized protein B0P05DRAFT_572952 [Gilbertella persicaria]KAI8073397.1 hypothetical protein B0P05DRAFT_572952 [Gilbertella persicaria]RCH89585.1 hypothetical protein CU098_003887 [Rhizopus stolonifer]
MQKGNPIKNVSATSAIDLKAELAQHLDQFEKTRSSQGKQVTARRPDKKPTVWSRQNKGIQDRSKNDTLALPAVETDVLVRSREQLEKKARYYEAMQAGEIEFDEEDEEKMPLIDFDKKYMQERELEKEHTKNKKRRTDSQEDSDPWVEIEDEFGRTRIVRQSQVGSTMNPEKEEEEKREKLRPLLDYEKADRSNLNHYEADREIRTKGVGFYQFSKDEQERQAQMDKLNKLRQETEQARQSTVSAANKRKQMMTQNAAKIRARKAALQAKKHPLTPDKVPTVQPTVDEASVTDFLQSIRKELE